MNAISFWVQIRGVPPYLSSEKNLRCLASKIGKVETMEDPSKARGFLRVKVEVDTLTPLTGVGSRGITIMNHGLSSSTKGYKTFVIDVEESDIQTLSVRLSQ